MPKSLCSISTFPYFVVHVVYDGFIYLNYGD
jgi:hypothetical protein